MFKVRKQKITKRKLQVTYLKYPVEKPLFFYELRITHCFNTF